MNNPTAPSDKGLLEEIKERASPILSCFGLSEDNDVNDEIYCAAIRIAVRNHEAAYPKDVARLILRHLIGQLPKRLVELFETFVPDGNLDATDDQLTKFRREINRYESLLGEDGSRESFYDEVRVKLGCVGLTASDPKILEAGWELTIHDTDSYYQREWTPDDIARHIIQREYGSRLVMDDENLYEFLSDDMEVFLETAECLRRRGLAASPTDICYAHNYGTVFYADKYLMERSKGVPEDICQWLILERKTWKQSDWNPEDELAAQGLLDLSVDVKSGVASLLDLSEDGSLGLDDEVSIAASPTTAATSTKAPPTTASTSTKPPTTAATSTKAPPTIASTSTKVPTIAAATTIGTSAASNSRAASETVKGLSNNWPVELMNAAKSAIKSAGVDVSKSGRGGGNRVEGALQENLCTMVMEYNAHMNSKQIKSKTSVLLRDAKAEMNGTAAEKQVRNCQYRSTLMKDVKVEMTEQVISEIPAYDKDAVLHHDSDEGTLLTAAAVKAIVESPIFQTPAHQVLLANASRKHPERLAAFGIEPMPEEDINDVIEKNPGLCKLALNICYSNNPCSDLTGTRGLTDAKEVLAGAAKTEAPAKLSKSSPYYNARLENPSTSHIADNITTEIFRDVGGATSAPVYRSRDKPSARGVESAFQYLLLDGASFVHPPDGDTSPIQVTSLIISCNKGSNWGGEDGQTHTVFITVVPKVVGNSTFVCQQRFVGKTFNSARSYAPHRPPTDGDCPSFHIPSVATYTSTTDAEVKVTKKRKKTDVSEASVNLMNQYVIKKKSKEE